MRAVSSTGSRRRPIVIAYGTNENWRWNGARGVVEFTVHDEARLEVFGDAGHCLHIEQPEKVADTVSEFLAG